MASHERLQRDCTNPCDSYREGGGGGSRAVHTGGVTSSVLCPNWLRSMRVAEAALQAARGQPAPEAESERRKRRLSPARAGRGPRTVSFGPAQTVAIASAKGMDLWMRKGVGRRVRQKQADEGAGD